MTALGSMASLGFTRLQERGRVVFSAAIDGRVYARHGTSIDTRLLVIDRSPASDPLSFPASPGIAPDTDTLLEWVTGTVPARLPTSPALPDCARSKPGAAVAAISVRSRLQAVTHPTAQHGAPLVYNAVTWSPTAGSNLTDSLYENYALQSVRIEGARPHPTKLVQSAAMASVAPPQPSYKPLLPPAVASSALLSDAQLESVIYAGEAHSGFLTGRWTVDETYDNLTAAADDASSAVVFRRGWMLGDGTGAGKGRQVAGIVLDNWLHGRTRAVWISKSDKLIEDAQRDWSPQKAARGARSQAAEPSHVQQSRR